MQEEIERNAQKRQAKLDRQFEDQKTLYEQELAQLTQVLGETAKLGLRNQKN
ncbi:MAG: hypothetical protein WAM94_10710 [Chromatiaceae bacterium]